MASVSEQLVENTINTNRLKEVGYKAETPKTVREINDLVVLDAKVTHLIATLKAEGVLGENYGEEENE